MDGVGGCHRSAVARAFRDGFVCLCTCRFHCGGDLGVHLDPHHHGGRLVAVQYSVLSQSVHRVKGPCSSPVFVFGVSPLYGPWSPRPSEGPSNTRSNSEIKAPCTTARRGERTPTQLRENKCMGCESLATRRCRVDPGVDPRRGALAVGSASTARRFTESARQRPDEHPRDAAGVQPHQGRVSGMQFK